MMNGNTKTDQHFNIYIDLLKWRKFLKSTITYDFFRNIIRLMGDFNVFLLCTKFSHSVPATIVCILLFTQILGSVSGY